MATKSQKPPNIDNLDLVALEALNKATQQRMKSIREDERLKLRAEFEQRATESGFSLAEVVGVQKLPRASRKGASEPKYKGPEGQLYSGKGRKPKWLVEALDSGQKLEEFAI